MAQVPDQIQQWLYSVLLNEYRDAQGTFRDCVTVLSTFPSLSPRTDVYTYNSGQPALLLCLSGTLPVNFRGTEYRFPVTVWVPHAYPRDAEGIMVYVVPGESMAIRPGQHVSVDGRVYHPYLRDWAVRERSSIVDFLRLLQDVFAREPPVVAKQQSSIQRPPPPPKQVTRTVQAVEMAATERGVPPRPPKAGHQSHSVQDGPPLPPLPHERRAQSPTLHSGNASSIPQRPLSTQQRYSAAPPLPHELRREYRQSPVSRYSQPAPLPNTQPQQMPYRPAQHQPQQKPQYAQHQPQQQPQYAQHYQQQHQNHQQMAHPPPQQYPPQHMPHPQQQPPKPTPAPDLLTDPFDVTLPTSTQTGPAPPIPPNPEKEHLLHLLSNTLVSQVHQNVSQNHAALAPLRAQSIALQEAHSRLTSEISHLQSLDTTLSTNEQILHNALHACDSVIETSKNTPDPPIDDVLVAPTVAATQLWNLQAEEAALKEALWCLQRAVGAGRVSGEGFVRLTRSLARELFLKMALSRKVARGLGLDVGVGEGEGFTGY